jgi:hypothetical protein
VVLDSLYTPLVVPLGVGIIQADEALAMRLMKSFVATVFLAGMPCQYTIGQEQGKPVPGVAQKVDFRYIVINSTEQDRKTAVRVFRKVVHQLDRLVFVSGDFLYRSCALNEKGKLESPRYEVGNITENYSTGDLQIESITLNAAVELEQRAESKSFGKEWLKEQKRLEEFVKTQTNKSDYLPSADVTLEPISLFFAREEFRSRIGGACINTAEFSLGIRLGSRNVLIEPPAMSLPSWVHYFDPRALGLSDRREISMGTSLGKVLLRHNTGEAFSVETLPRGHYVTVAFERAVRRMLFDPEQGYLPIYSADFRGGSKGEDKAVLIEKPRLQSWLKAVQVGQRWMPERLRLLDSQGLVDIEFKWWRVSTDIPDDAFTIDAIPLPPGTRVIDRRSVPPVTTFLGP